MSSIIVTGVGVDRDGWKADLNPGVRAHDEQAGKGESSG